MSNIVKIRNSINNYFESQREEHEKVKADNNRRRWGKYYGTKQWKALRQQYYLDHPICEMHEKYGIIVPTTCIHHLRPYSTGITEEAKWRLLLNYNNLCACCDSCHAEFHRQLKLQNTDYLEEIVPVDIQLDNYK